MFNRGVKLANLDKHGKQYCYKGKRWTLDKPSKRGDKMMVLASKTINGQKRAKIIQFKNSKEQVKKSSLSAKDPWCAEYWACRGASKTKRKSHRKAA